MHPITLFCHPSPTELINKKENDMNTVQPTGMDLKARLSAIWLFATLNYLYCDVVTVMDPEKLNQFISGTVGGMQITPGFLLGASILVEIPIAMVFLSRLLKGRPNRWANILAGILMTVVQTLTLLTSTPTIYYIFFSLVEIAATTSIVWYAWRWVIPHERPIHQERINLREAQ
jgi:hypothetical protein